MDIAKHIETYGIDNLRVFIEHEDTQGFFRNPLGGIREYRIEKCVPVHRIDLRLVGDVAQEILPGDHQYGGLMDSIYNTERKYTHDFDLLCDPRCRQPYRVYVLVDEDNKYERLY